MLELDLHVETEALAIYRWWTAERPLELQRLEKFKNANRIDEYAELERKVRQEEQVFLCRLIEIRPALWT